MIKAKLIPGGTLLTSGRSEPPTIDLDTDDVVRAIHAVAERYGTDPTDLVLNDLAFRMALTREPELQIQVEKKRATKPTAWTFGKLWRLWFDFSVVLHDNPNQSIEWCSRRVERLPHWEGMTVSRERFYEAQRHPIGQFMEKMTAQLGFEVVQKALSGVDWESLNKKHVRNP